MHCKNCKFWTPYNTKYPNGSGHRGQASGGICHSPKITEDYGSQYMPDMLVYTYSEGGKFWTGSDFGCINYADRR
jgi:hypothetical protein